MPFFYSEDLPDGIPTTNPEKLAERTALLLARPELVLRIAVPALREIIDLIDFKCGNSSIARDQAIEGSDIDLGLVITQDPATVEEERAFVEELRQQGFTAYDSREVAEAEAARLASVGMAEQYDMIGYAIHRDLARIDFMTLADLEAGKGTNNQKKVYESGYSIVHKAFNHKSF